MRILYHWKLVGEEGGGFAAASMVLALLAGIPLLAARLNGWSPATSVPPSWAVGCSAVALAAAALCWLVFWRRQDEMFARIQAKAWGRAGVATSLVLALWGLLNASHVAGPIAPLAPLLILASAKALFWLAAVRRWL